MLYPHKKAEGMSGQESGDNYTAWARNTWKKEIPDEK
jgi:hypothetical protein